MTCGGMVAILSVAAMLACLGGFMVVVAVIGAALGVWYLCEQADGVMRCQDCLNRWRAKPGDLQ